MIPELTEAFLLSDLNGNAIGMIGSSSKRPVVHFFVTENDYQVWIAEGKIKHPEIAQIILDYHPQLLKLVGNELTKRVTMEANANRECMLVGSKGDKSVVIATIGTTRDGTALN